MAMEQQKKSFLKSLFGQTLIAVMLGILVGIILGDTCSIFKPIGSLFVSLLLIFLYPFIICSILSGLGKLSVKQTSLILKPAAIGLFLVLLVTFLAVWTLTLAIPTVKQLGTLTISAPSQTNLINLLISTNIFAALAENNLPAVIVFCLILALMLQRMKNAENLFQNLDVISNACIEFWNLLVKISPFAVFFITANASGTMKLSQLTDAALFIFLFFSGCIILGFWLLPIMITCFTNIRYKNIIYELREALILSSTIAVVMSLPFILNFTLKSLNGKQNNRQEIKEITETCLIIAFTLASLGSFFAYLYIEFAQLYFNKPIHPSEKLLLPFMTYISQISGATAAVSYLTDWLHLPKDALQLWISFTAFTSYGSAIVSVFSMLFFTVFVTAAYTGNIIFKPVKLIIHLFLAAIILIGITQIKHLMPDPAHVSYNRLMNSEITSPYVDKIKVTYIPSLNEARLKSAKNAEDSLKRIHRTGTIRVGYNSNLFPFSFYNRKHHLVGYSTSLMYELASSLNAKLEFIPYNSPYLVSDLQANAFDIAIGGIIVTEKRLKKISYTDPYMETQASFIVPKVEVAKFKTPELIHKISHLRLGMLNSPVLIDFAKQLFPGATIVTLENSDSAFVNALKNNIVDAILWTQVRSQPWVLGHKDYESVTPPGLSHPFLLAYAVQKTSSQFLQYLNYWLKLKDTEGYRQRIYKHWILLYPVTDNRHRWSVIQDVLHWKK